MFGMMILTHISHDLYLENWSGACTCFIRSQIHWDFLPAIVMISYCSLQTHCFVLPTLVMISYFRITNVFLQFEYIIMYLVFHY